MDEAKEMRLENWEVEEYSPGKRWIVGQVFGHPQYYDGKFVHTSTLVELDFPSKTAKTLNSTYRLGTPRGGSAGTLSQSETKQEKPVDIT
jgi:hypothetical protein